MKKHFAQIYWTIFRYLSFAIFLNGYVLLIKYCLNIISSYCWPKFLKMSHWNRISNMDSSNTIKGKFSIRSLTLTYINFMFNLFFFYSRLWLNDYVMRLNTKNPLFFLAYSPSCAWFSFDKSVSTPSTARLSFG